MKSNDSKLGYTALGFLVGYFMNKLVLGWGKHLFYWVAFVIAFIGGWYLARYGVSINIGGM